MFGFGALADSAISDGKVKKETSKGLVQMIPYYGDFSEDDTVQIPFNTFSHADPTASVTITDLADSDIMVHKDGSVTQIVTDGASVAIDFDSITGNHLITIDSSVHADYATGSEYAVRIEGTTVNGATINSWVGTFSIERTGAALAIAKLIQAAVITNAAGADVAADIIAMKVDTAAILIDTGTTIPGTITTVDTVVDGIQTDLSNATDGLGAIAANIATVDTVVDAVKVTTDKFAFGVANQVDANIESVNTQAITGDGGVGTEFQGA